MGPLSNRHGAPAQLEAWVSPLVCSSWGPFSLRRVCSARLKEIILKKLCLWNYILASQLLESLIFIMVLKSFGRKSTTICTYYEEYSRVLNRKYTWKFFLVLLKKVWKFTLTFSHISNGFSFSEILAVFF